MGKGVGKGGRVCVGKMKYRSGSGSESKVPRLSMKGKRTVVSNRVQGVWKCVG